MTNMKPLIPLLFLLAVLAVLATAGCIQPQIPDPHPTPLPTAPLPSEDTTFRIRDTHQYLSYWNEKMGWNLTNETLAEHTAALNRYLETTWTKESGDNYRVQNNSDFLHAVKNIIDLTEEQFDAFVRMDAEQTRVDRLNYHSHTSRLYDTPANQI
ncbi:MAG: hypothetical protein O0X96_00370 [Methanocorpusculum sp.]|nr:hypothetical protein [Methanocorpusculum sp.]